MPTPNDDVAPAVPHPYAPQAFYWSLHNSCPPEDLRALAAAGMRSQLAPDPNEVAVEDDVQAHEQAHAEPDEHQQQPQQLQDEGMSSPAATQDQDAISDTSSDSLSPMIHMADTRRPKTTQNDFPTSPQSTTNISTPLPSSNDASNPRTAPRYTSSFLRPGSRFEGTQQSDKQTYNVQVEVKHVDMSESFICGFLKIEGLTADHPTLTTYFEGEIIGNKYSFITRHPEWGSNEKVDFTHWRRFDAFVPLHKSAKRPGFSYKKFYEREHIFMRWKEYFLVPDHRVRTISGASFEGFYYICFNQAKGTVEGIYFHSKSEKFQHLELKHVDDRGCCGAIELR